MNGNTYRQIEALQTEHNYGTISVRRKIEIFSQISRHLTALLYLIAELVIGVRPEKL